MQKLTKIKATNFNQLINNRFSGRLIHAFIYSTVQDSCRSDAWLQLLFCVNSKATGQEKLLTLIYSRITSIHVVLRQREMPFILQYIYYILVKNNGVPVYQCNVMRHNAVRFNSGRKHSTVVPMLQLKQMRFLHRRFCTTPDFTEFT